MKAIIEIDCGNAAFTDPSEEDDAPFRDVELARILRDAARHLQHGSAGNGLALFDINGNKVGTYRLEE